MVFHDLCHGSFFPSDERKNHSYGINKCLAVMLDFLYGYPGNKWIYIHSTHHDVHGDINKYDTARSLFASSEYCKLDDNLRYMYDIFRTPIFFFIFVPIWTFFLAHIYTFDVFYLTKLFIILYFITKIFNYKVTILVLIAYYLTCIMGTMLFHLQHSVNNPSWKEINNDNEKINADFSDSSVLEVPLILKPFTNGIEYHNIHHLNPGVPSYNLQECYEELKKKNMIHNPEVDFKGVITALNHTLYDEERDLYVNHVETSYKCKNV